MTTANNHTNDGGSEGMFMTNRLLDEARITHAGSGTALMALKSMRGFDACYLVEADEGSRPSDSR
jgi:hypothetical protein